MNLYFLKKRKLKFLLVNNGYPPALDYFKIKRDNKSYEEYKKELSENLLDIASLYSLNLNKIGCHAVSILSNHEFLQKKWAEEKKLKFSDFSFPHFARRSFFLRETISKFPKLYYIFKNLTEKKTWGWQIMLNQIKEIKPDVLIIFDFHYFSPSFLKEIKKHVRIIVGKIAAPIMMPDEYFKNYDILLSPMPHYVEKFKKMGIKSLYFPFAFESSILEKIINQKKIYDCVYVGGLSKGVDKVHFLEEASERVNIDFWGYGQPPLDKSSSVWKNYHGQAWGIDLFKILMQSKIIVNCHTKKIGKFYRSKYADNVRLYEATGSGAMLITDYKENLGELFEIGKEVETYNSLDELVEKIKYYLKNDRERKKIALAGQKRTLKDHTFFERAKKLLEIVV